MSYHQSFLMAANQEEILKQSKKKTAEKRPCKTFTEDLPPETLAEIFSWIQLNFDDVFNFAGVNRHWRAVTFCAIRRVIIDRDANSSKVRYCRERFRSLTSLCVHISDLSEQEEKLAIHREIE